MDKVEYRELIRNIKSKYLQKDYEGVIEISDQLDPGKIKENSILEIIAKAYEALGRSDLAKDVLLIAYKRTPTGKRIAYNLAMLCIKLDDLDSAVMFYEDFCKMAPKDNQRLLLKYEIGKAGGISISKLAKVLESYNSREMDDKWEYELARLYHEMGDDEKCAATCDQIILWYANGEYEKKALELKNMHKALTSAQQARYEELMKDIIYPVADNDENKADEVPESQEPAKTAEVSVQEEQPEPDLTEEQLEKETSQEEQPEKESMEDVMAGIAEDVEAAREEEEAAARETVSDAEQQEIPAEEKLPEIDYETTHLAPQTYTEETESEDEENIAGQLSLSAMLDAFRNQTIEDREQMNKVGEDRAAQIMAEVNDAHDSSILKQFDKDEDDNEPVGEIIEPEVPLLNREDVTEPVDDGGEDLGERAAEFAFEKTEEKEEQETGKGKESSVDATQFIPVAEINAQISDEAREELDDEEEIPPSVIGETSVYEEIDPGSAAGKVDVGSSAGEEPGLDMEELMNSIKDGEEPTEEQEGSEETIPEDETEEAAAEEPIAEEPVAEEPVTEEPVAGEPVSETAVPEKEPEKEFVLDLIFGNSVIPQRRKKEKKAEPVAEETVTEDVAAVEETAEEVIEDVKEAVTEDVTVVEETAEEVVEVVKEAATKDMEAVEEAVEETIESVEEAAKEDEENVEATVEETVEEAVSETVEEIPESVEETVDDVKETIAETAENIEEPEEMSEEEVLKEDLFVSRSRAQEDAVLNGGFSFRDSYKKKDKTAGSGAATQKAQPVKSNKEKLREEKKKEKALRREMHQEERLRKEEERVEKLREEQKRKERLHAEQLERERLREEQEREEQLRAEKLREEEAERELLVEEQLPEEQLPEKPLPEEQFLTEETETEDLYVEESEDEEKPESLFQRGVSRIGGFFHSLLKPKDKRKDDIDIEETESEPEDEEDILEELMDSVLAQEEEEKELSPEEEQEEAAEAAAAETTEKLKEFVAKEETEESEDEEEPEEEQEEESEEETEESESESEDEEETEEEPESVPVMKKPEKNPEADAAAAAALEKFRQLSVKEEEEAEKKTEEKAAESEEVFSVSDFIEETNEEELSINNFIEPESGSEPVCDEEEERPVRKRKDRSRSARNREEEHKPLRGNKVYKGNKEPRGNKGNKIKKEKHMKNAAQFGEELFAETEGKKKRKGHFDLEELLDEVVPSDQPAGRTPVSEESLNDLLSTSIDPSKSAAESPKENPQPARELNVSESGEFDLDGFIEKDKPKEDPKQMSFDDLFGGEFRPKVRVPAEATSKFGTKKLVLNKKYKLSKEQRKALGEFLMIDGMEEEICGAIDNLITKKKSGDETGGHMIVTGDAKSGKTYLAIEIIKAVNQEIGHGNPRVAKVQAQAINGKNIRKILSKVSDSDLIIENIGKLEDATARDIISAVRENDASTMVILEGNELAADTLIQKFPDLVKVFKTRVDIGELTLTQWGDIAQKYAQSQGYSIDSNALLALHAKIDKINTSDVKLGFSQVKRIVDEAIEKAEKHGSGKLFSAFAGKIEDSLIPLTEDSFM